MSNALAIPRLDCRAGTLDEAEARVAALLRRIGRDRDRAAFAEFHALAAPRARLLFLAGAPDMPEAVADEMVQDLMAAVWAEAPGYDRARHGAPSAWVYAMGRAAQLRATERFRGRQAAEEAALPSRPRVPEGPEERAARADALRRLRAHLESLPRQDAALLRDALFAGLSHAAIAARRGLPVGTVKARLARAVDKLREGMGL